MAKVNKEMVHFLLRCSGVEIAQTLAHKVKTKARYFRSYWTEYFTPLKVSTENTISIYIAKHKKNPQKNIHFSKVLLELFPRADIKTANWQMSQTNTGHIFLTIWIPAERNRQRSDERDLDTRRWRSDDVNVRFPFVCLSAVCLFVLFLWKSTPGPENWIHTSPVS